MSALEYTQGHDVCLKHKKSIASCIKTYATFIGKIQYRASFFKKIYLGLYSLPTFIECLVMKNALMNSCDWIYV